jgi:hypothetical protein
MKRHVAVTIAALIACQQAAGQDIQLQPPRWSPLDFRADLPRFLPTSFPGLTAPVKRAAPGLFWSAGNPAGLAWEVGDTRSDYWLTHSAKKGDYRRPLDAPQVSSTQVNAAARGALTPDAGAIGDVLTENRQLAPGPRVDQLEANGSSPLVLADTALASMRTTRARLQGAGGWSVGDWAAGVSAGYETEDLHTEREGFVRLDRRAGPGVLVGIARRFRGQFDLAIGAHAGFQRSAETGDFVAESEQGRVFPLEGYRDVPPIDVRTTYYQRLEQRAQFSGAEAAGGLLGMRWSAGAEYASRRDATWHAEIDNPLKDEWKADAWTVQGDVSRSLLGGIELSVILRSTALAGDLTLASDSAGASFHSHERTSDLGIGIRPPAVGRVATHLLAAIRDERRAGDDVSANTHSDLHTREPALAAAATYAATDRISIRAGLALAWYRAQGGIPSADGHGIAFQRFLYPELALSAAPANTRAAHVLASWQIKNTVSGWGLFTFETTSPTQSAIALSPLTAGQHRLTQRALVGVSIRPHGSSRPLDE